MGQESSTIQRFRHVWNHVKTLDGKSAVSITTLPNSQRAAMIAALKRWDRELGRRDTDDTPLSEAVIERVHLKVTGSPEMVMTGSGQLDCSPTGNCSIWVLQPANDGYRVILESLGQTFSTGSSRTKGYHDIFVNMHGSAYETTVKFYNSAVRDINEPVVTTLSSRSPTKMETFRNLPRITPCRRK
jgi:hypothetical protein